MKNIKISPTRIKKEITVVSVCFLIAVAFNVFSIIINKTSWSEIVGKLPIVLLVAVLIYVLVLMFRIFAWGILKLFQNK